MSEAKETAHCESNKMHSYARMTKNTFPVVEVVIARGGMRLLFSPLWTQSKLPTMEILIQKEKNPKKQVVKNIQTEHQVVINNRNVIRVDNDFLCVIVNLKPSN